MNPNSWTRAILMKVTANTWEVLDENADAMIDTAEWEADTTNGLKEMWDLYAKNPSSADIDLATKESKQIDDDVPMSPKRKAAREAATENQKKQAKVMEARAKSSDGGPIALGDIVQVSVPSVDKKSKVDTNTITTVIVKVLKNDYYKVACKHGLLKPTYAYHRLTRVSNEANSRELHDLEGVYLSWTGLPVIAERTAAQLNTVVPTAQGVMKCQCTKECSTLRCPCKKAGHFCNSKCHKGNTKCKNCDTSSLL
jgi:hypothetical protein